MGLYPCSLTLQAASRVVVSRNSITVSPMAGCGCAGLKEGQCGKQRVRRIIYSLKLGMREGTVQVVL
jgi:hypothetical protein